MDGGCWLERERGEGEEEDGRMFPGSAHFVVEEILLMRVSSLGVFQSLSTSLSDFLPCASWSLL